MPAYCQSDDRERPIVGVLCRHGQPSARPARSEPRNLSRGDPVPTGTRPIDGASDGQLRHPCLATRLRVRRKLAGMSVSRPW